MSMVHWQTDMVHEQRDPKLSLMPPEAKLQLSRALDGCEKRALFHLNVGRPEAGRLASVLVTFTSKSLGK